MRAREREQPPLSGAGSATAVSAPKVSVVLATYNRLQSLLRLLSCLAEQMLPPHLFEVIIADDGSSVPVRAHVDARQYAFPVSVIEQENTGPSAARHRGVLEACGEILVLAD